MSDGEDWERIVGQLAMLAAQIKSHVSLAKCAKTIQERDDHLDAVVGIAAGLVDVADGVSFI
jgi:hypothetical protein